MRALNNENIDEIMFQLLEGEITGIERERLLEAIEADPAYSKLWAAWQSTILSPESDEPSFDIQTLKKNSGGGRVIPFNFKYAVAAAIVLAIGVFAFRASLTEKGNIEISGTNPKVRTLQTPAQPDKVSPLQEVKAIKKDSVVSLKEKVRHMAEMKNQKQKVENPVYTPTPIEMPERFVDNKQEIKKEITIETPKQKQPEMIETPKYSDVVYVSVDNQDNKKKTTDTKENKTFFGKLLGGSRIRLANDSNTLTNKKIVIENNKYQIIAGF